MRLLFLIPPRTTVLNRDFASSHISPSIAVASMTANAGRDVETGFLDAFAERLSLDSAVARVCDFRPDLLALSSLTVQIHEAAETVVAVKRKLPDLPVVVGGPHTSKIPELTLSEFPCFDYVAAGEGEGIIRDMAERFRNHSPADDVPGVYTMNDGLASSGGPRPFISDLDTLEFPDWSAFRWKHYCAIFTLRRERVREILVSTIRGCPYNCIFCPKILGNEVRTRSVPIVLEEVSRNVEKYGARQILFTDETFTVDRNRAASLCEGIARLGLHEKMRWVCVTRPDKLDRELLALMKKSGCHAVIMGADSMNDDTLAMMRKNTTSQKIVEAVTICRSLGILTEASYVLGMPEDTESSIRNTIRQAMRVNSHFATFSILVPYPGTRIMEMAENGDQGLKLLTKNWRFYGKQLGHALETRNLDRCSLEKLQRLAYYRYYLRPGKFKAFFQQADLLIVIMYFLAHMLKRLGVDMPMFNGNQLPQKYGDA